MSTNPDFINQLIDLAAAAAGSDYKLAQMLEVSRGNVGDWRKSRRTCPVGDVALMAEIAGLKPEEWVARALIAQYEGTTKGDKIYRALGKVSAAIGGAIATSGANALQIFSPEGTSNATAFIDRCIYALHTMYRNVKFQAVSLQMVTFNRF